MKPALRARGRANAPSPQDRPFLSERIGEHLTGSLLFAGARQVAIFHGLPWEPDLAGVWKVRPEACFYPRVDPPHRLEFFRIRAPSDLVPGFAGILEPPVFADRAARPWTREDLVLVPGSAFDRQGGRVGSGLGFYDRFLEKNPARRVGVCFVSQIVKDALAQEAFDARMDGLCSEEGLELFT